MLIKKVKRIFRHAFATAHLPVSNRLEQRIGSAISAAEKSTTAEIKVIIEKRLPLSYLRRNAHAVERAHRLFSTYRVWDTQENNGLLLYILVADRAIEIVTDRGISQKLGTEKNTRWQIVIDELAAQLKNEQVENGLDRAIAHIADVLSNLYPCTPNTQQSNEISNRGVVL